MTSEVPLYESDPEAWRAHSAEGNRTQPRKRVGADVLFRDDAGRILLVNPRYKPDWDLPGGMAEANEPPLDAARREVKEELGLEFSGGRVLVIDWVSPHGPWDDSLMFIFDGGVLADELQALVKLRDGELSEPVAQTVRLAAVGERSGRAAARKHGLPAQRRQRWRAVLTRQCPAIRHHRGADDFSEDERRCRG